MLGIKANKTKQVERNIRKKLEEVDEALERNEGNKYKMGVYNGLMYALTQVTGDEQAMYLTIDEEENKTGRTIVSGTRKGVV